MELGHRHRRLHRRPEGAGLGFDPASLIVAGVILLFMLAVSIFVARSITGPLQRMTVTMNDLAGGNLAVEVPGIGRGDEIGEMAKAVEVSRAMPSRARRWRPSSARRRPRGREPQGGHEQDGRRFRRRGRPDRRDGFVGSTELEVSAGTLTATAERAQELATTVAAASEEASTNVQSVASATEEMASSVNEISRQVQESARMANEPSIRRRGTNDASANCRRRQPASATSSN